MQSRSLGMAMCHSNEGEAKCCKLRMLTLVILLEILFSKSSRKMLSQPDSLPQPRAAKSGPSRIHSDSLSTKLCVLLMRLCTLR